MNSGLTKRVKRCSRLMLAMLLLLWQISMTGCSRYVVVPGGETIQVNVQQWDQMRADNEQLLQELAGCRKK
jgi:hypothetical protein